MIDKNRLPLNQDTLTRCAGSAGQRGGSARSEPCRRCKLVAAPRPPSARSSTAPRPPPARPRRRSAPWSARTPRPDGPGAAADTRAHPATATGAVPGAAPLRRQLHHIDQPAHVSRLTPRRSAAWCVVSIFALGATVTPPAMRRPALGPLAPPPATPPGRARPHPRGETAARPGHRYAARARRGSQRPPPTPHSPSSAGATCADPRLGARADVQVIGSVSLISLTGMCAADLSPR